MDKLSGVNQNMIYSSRGVNPTTSSGLQPLCSVARAPGLMTIRANTISPVKKHNSGTTQTSLLREGAQVKFWADGMQGNNAMCEVPIHACH